VSTNLGDDQWLTVAENQFDLLKQADLALYDAKAHGKSTHRFFNLQLQYHVHVDPFLFLFY